MFYDRTVAVNLLKSLTFNDEFSSLVNQTMLMFISNNMQVLVIIWFAFDVMKLGQIGRLSILEIIVIDQDLYALMNI